MSLCQWPASQDSSKYAHLSLRSPSPVSVIGNLLISFSGRSVLAISAVSAAASAHGEHRNGHVAPLPSARGTPPLLAPQPTAPTPYASWVPTSSKPFGNLPP